MARQFRVLQPLELQEEPSTSAAILRLPTLTPSELAPQEDPPSRPLPRHSLPPPPVLVLLLLLLSSGERRHNLRELEARCSVSELEEEISSELLDRGRLPRPGGTENEP